MEGRQPKRRKDKYNPYEIYEKDGKYYVSFRNGEKEYKDLEIGKNVYEAFNTFELQDVSHMNVVDRHLEQSEIWDSSLYERVFQKEEGVEDTVLNKLEAECLHSAIQQLSEIQRRRLMKYYFEDKNYEQIAQEEGCSFQMVAKSVKAAIRRSTGIPKIIEKPLVVSLCRVCAGNFYEVPGHYIRRVNPEQRYKDTCMFCNVRNGYDYYIGRKNK